MTIWQGRRGAGALGFCSTGGVATATFTVPAGTWYLRGLVQTLKTYLKIGKEYDFTGTPVFHATLTRADGTVVDLGTVTVTKHELVSAFWPQTFTVAEEQQVTLTQETHSAFGLVDELRLTRAGATDFGNLIPGADFESDGWSSYVVSDTPATKYGSATCTAYSDRPWHWGYGVWGGLYRLKLNNAHGMARDMTIPEAGRYRFTMRLRARADKNWYANNPVRVWLAKGGVTNVLATTPTVFTRNWMEVSYGATVAEAGTWRLGIEGRCGKEDVVDAATGRETFADVEADIDDVSLVRDFDVRDAAPSLPHGLRFEVAKGATLLLDYPGTATCGPVVYDGTVYTGLISAATHPAFVTGAGALQAIPAGTVFLLR